MLFKSLHWLVLPHCHFSSASQHCCDIFFAAVDPLVWVAEGWQSPVPTESVRVQSSSRQHIGLDYWPECSFCPLLVDDGLALVAGPTVAGYLATEVTPPGSPPYPTL